MLAVTMSLSAAYARTQVPRLPKMRSSFDRQFNPMAESSDVEEDPEMSVRGDAKVVRAKTSYREMET